MRRAIYIVTLGTLWTLAFAGLVSALEHAIGGRPSALLLWAAYGGAAWLATATVALAEEASPSHWEARWCIPGDPQGRF